VTEFGPAPIGGAVAAGFAPVRDAFAENFSTRGEIGASVCIVLEGTVVVDLCGGWRDGAGQRPWEHDTLVNVFSVGKAIAALCVARLVGRGALAYDDPVARVWPEFAAHGKSGITVRQLLSHQAGLPAVRRRLPDGAIFDWDTMCAALADQAPWWNPGTAHGYHVNTFGFLVGEIVRRARGSSLGSMVAQEIAGPLGADFFIGLPPAELGRVADFIGMVDPPERISTDEMDDDRLMEHHAYFNPPTFSGSGVINTTRWRTAELPSTNGHASARGIARIYQALATGGRRGEIELVPAAVLVAATEEVVCGEDVILHRPSRFGLGFQLTQPERPLGPNGRSFGHFGAGGSLGFCDPDVGLAFGYAINTMGPRWQNPRNQALIDACYDCL
jgi:CubicO group peptidase (beta-lactamase class C family)